MMMMPTAVVTQTTAAGDIDTNLLPRNRLQLARRLSTAWLLYREIEIGGGIRLAHQRVVPKFERVVLETSLLHEAEETHAIVMRVGADVGSGVRNLVEAIEAAAHVDAADDVTTTQTQQKKKNMRLRKGGNFGDDDLLSPKRTPSAAKQGCSCWPGM